MGQARIRGTFEQRRAQAVAKFKQANLVILTSMEPYAPANQWVPVIPEQVPKAVKKPEVIGQLVNGKICQPERGGPWYRAEHAT